MIQVSIGMQLNATVEEYEQMGRVMDQIERKLKKALEKEGVKARFDFTSFNTNPCKAIQMDRDRYEMMEGQDAEPEIPGAMVRAMPQTAQLEVE